MEKGKERKVYDYNQEKVQESLLRIFRSSKREATVADLAGLIGLPLQQIQAEMPALSDEYRGRLKVTESGEILYSFPDGLKSRYRGFGPAIKKIWKAVKKGVIEISKALFKAWIVVMLVGYFVLFIALALFAMIASIAMQQGGSGRSSRSDSRGGGGLGGLWLTGRLFDSIIRIWFYSELFKSPETRFRQAQSRAQRRPLHKAVFSHVFGDGDPNQGWAETEKKAVVAFLQTHKGVMTMPEFIAITGRTPQDAETAISSYLLEFEGTPEVTENGALYFSFPKLLTRIGTTPDIYGSSAPLKKLKSFSSNTKKADNTFRLINLANVLFGGYFLANAISVGNMFYINTARGLALRGGFPFLYSATGYLFEMLGSANPVNLIFWGLGITPLFFSILFFAVPILRSIRLSRENEQIKAENLRKIMANRILVQPLNFVPAVIEPMVPEAAPANPRTAELVSKELAAWAQAEPIEGTYRFDRIYEVQKEIESIRSRIDIDSLKPGKTIFDSHA